MISSYIYENQTFCYLLFAERWAYTVPRKKIHKANQINHVNEMVVYINKLKSKRRFQVMETYNDEAMPQG